MSSPLRSIHVVAGVIVDVRGRVLLARRGEDSDLAGLWEFPGGKREPGETSEQALVRELHEELGIEAEVGEALIEVPQEYPGKRLRLEVRRVPRWKGTPRGREGQALTWVAPDRLLRYSMPSADLPVVGALRQPDRYLVTPEPGADLDAWLAGLDDALAGGIARVQLRAPGAAAGTPAGRWRDLAEATVTRCRDAGAEILLNRDLALAAELGVGVHLGSEQLAALASRPLPPGATVGASCHTLAELEAAQALGCDFAVLGPVRATATHPGAATLGWDGFARLRERVGLPIYAIGGLGPDDLPEARRQGAQGIAAIRSFWPAS
ncbi:DNA mismatch repair protein MutT [Pseudoxanthomonas broegbernensis]|uniref:8-oxo-dGTP diphosphatase n=1 Tax=Pseudoxanthomonas broegbernensis TaxID=83619 RepID=A0A7V8GLW3_9GAMM|nr:Nudix family hydrolase [Pseudoxanthomonas broegbernensis]KAF1686024.1 DNA mismatch repair protein MutT [Pseudoxanthomonas broegbernensis]MBB6063719.1 8-oxo-dGTP diphosphatase [Pseudoxanthomonas broegbernensis]